MTDKFTKEHQYKVELCRQLINYSCMSKETEDIKPSELRSILLRFFTSDVINDATNIFLRMEKLTK